MCCSTHARYLAKSWVKVIEVITSKAMSHPCGWHYRNGKLGCFDNNQLGIAALEMLTMEEVLGSLSYKP